MINLSLIHFVYDWDDKGDYRRCRFENKNINIIIK